MFFFEETTSYFFFIYCKQELIQIFWLATSFSLRQGKTKVRLSPLTLFPGNPSHLLNFQQEGLRLQKETEVRLKSSSWYRNLGVTELWQNRGRTMWEIRLCIQPTAAAAARVWYIDVYLLRQSETALWGWIHSVSDVQQSCGTSGNMSRALLDL